MGKAPAKKTPTKPTVNSLQREVCTLERALDIEYKRRVASEKREVDIAKRRDHYMDEVDKERSALRELHRKHDNELARFRQQLRILVQQVTLAADACGVGQYSSEAGQSRRGSCGLSNCKLCSY